MTCPKCNGPMWDNRNDKRNPKAPDFKCKNRECGNAIWEKPRAANGGAPAPRANGGAPSWNAVAMTYKRCWDIAGKVVGADSPDRQAATATLFIQAAKMGLSVEPPKPPPPPPPPEPEYEPVAGVEDDYGY